MFPSSATGTAGQRLPPPVLTTKANTMLMTARWNSLALLIALSIQPHRHGPGHCITAVADVNACSPSPIDIITDASAKFSKSGQHKTWLDATILNSAIQVLPARQLDDRGADVEMARLPKPEGVHAHAVPSCNDKGRNRSQNG